jgi:GNAT superfamily N-acetyltransferase
MIINYKHFSSKSSHFDEFTQLYEAAFPENERRYITDLVRVIDEEERFHIIELESGYNFKGFISFWDFNWFVYLEHFAVIENDRGKGIGAQAIDHVLNSLKVPAILEVEPPVDALTQGRVDFYTRHGLKLQDDIDYTQPPYDKGKSSIQLRLMTYGEISRDKILHATAIIAENVYNCSKLPKN